MKISRKNYISNMYGEYAGAWPYDYQWATALDSDKQYKAMWEYYLKDVEDEVNREFNISVYREISQGNNYVYIVDESNSEFETIEISGLRWTVDEIEMASDSRDEAEYRREYKIYVSRIINEAWK